MNPLLLTVASERHGLQSRWWGIFKQWQEMGGRVMHRPSHVPNGEQGTRIVFCAPVTRKKTDANGDETNKRFWMLRTYVVFNLDQVEGEHLDHLWVGHGGDTRKDDSTDYSEADAGIAATSRQSPLTATVAKFLSRKLFCKKLEAGFHLPPPPCPFAPFSLFENPWESGAGGTSVCFGSRSTAFDGRERWNWSEASCSIRAWMPGELEDFPVQAMLTELRVHRIA